MNNLDPIAANLYYQVITNVAGQLWQPSRHNRIQSGGLYDLRLGIAKWKIRSQIPHLPSLLGNR
ncbi:MAG: hypothetical protein HC942_11285 [Microcoleus sp. SU_5_6]|nr:hypothetical protein [Microcoleus sp. SU_5_6]NJS12186.1 hypothetical protein [Microcoleus sp. CSU_2_2]